jgi:hypothetical protein
MGQFTEALTKRNHPTRKVQKWEHRRDPVIIDLTEADVSRDISSNWVAPDADLRSGSILKLPLSEEQHEQLKRRVFDGFRFVHNEGHIEVKNSNYVFEPAKYLNPHRLGNRRGPRTPAYWCIQGEVTAIRSYPNDRDPATDDVDLDFG